MIIRVYWRPFAVNFNTKVQKKASVGTDAFEVRVARELVALRAAFAARGIALAIVAAATAAATATALAAITLFAVARLAV